jgi:hypothetical protein
MVYDINAIKEKIAKLNNQGGGGKKEQREKIELPWWKPSIGLNEVRFVPYDNGEGQPFEEIGFYASPQLVERRIAAPCQWGLPDPINELRQKLEEDRSNDATWKLMKELRIKDCYFAPVLIRGQEHKGIQVWELNQNILKDVYSTLAHPDWQEDDLFDLKNGYDFTINCTETDKTFNNYKIKKYDVQVRRKSSPLLPTKKERDALLKDFPNIEGYFKQFVMGEPRLKTIVVNFLSGAEKNSSKEEGTEKTSEKDIEKEASSKIEDAFNDL